MTEAEFSEWRDSETRAEWVNGRVSVLRPTCVRHDDVSGWLRVILRQFVERFDLGRVLGPKTIVRLQELRCWRTPDILFIRKSRERSVKHSHVEGPPDIVMEVVGRDSQARDRREKFDEYERAGVREYWLVDPTTEQIQAYSLEGARYVEISPTENAVRSKILPGFYLPPAWFRSEALPKLLKL